jgi:hypothetical protein
MTMALIFLTLPALSQVENLCVSPSPVIPIICANSRPCQSWFPLAPQSKHQESCSLINLEITNCIRKIVGNRDVAMLINISPHDVHKDIFIHNLTWASQILRCRHVGMYLILQLQELCSQLTLARIG